MINWILQRNELLPTFPWISAQAETLPPQPHPEAAPTLPSAPGIQDSALM